jgi:hypothetical protein
VILDTKGNIFGGFTPVEWESPRRKLPFFSAADPYSKADDSLQSFLFTLKNPHNVPPQIFALRAEKRGLAMYCDSGYGPCFGVGDIAVCDNCNANIGSYTSLGHSYINNTGLGTEIGFTGSQNFQITEIEVFEITV